MLNTLWGVVKKEKIELLGKANIPEGTRVLVTVLPDDTGFTVLVENKPNLFGCDLE
ncbi:MAG: hypothetical protein M5U24_00360 [Candidatus Kuenenia sp.]|uniref:Uncharacterized protein n=1 Tax=Kuenenia stuttgartiensis TaxID=174633 RepID=A0A2C9CJW5_KUEST|nr:MULTISPECIES: hypothetical protein [Kuenenia]MCZ7611934.1 hypothetical protein [Ignavibacterium sp.]MCZ7620926.1 hypothetical protein [Candidatus Kuenenia sp.]SOH05888.1 hypothetical protein KSMBR1_3414 [Candidatus Kuenenia stuttgartiensis]